MKLLIIDSFCDVLHSSSSHFMLISCDKAIVLTKPTCAIAEQLCKAAIASKIALF